MKLLIILVFPLTLLALTPAQWDAEISAINESTEPGEVDIRAFMHKCGYSNPNMELFIKSMRQTDDTDKLDCMKGKVAEVTSDRSSSQTKKDGFRDDCIAVKDNTQLPAALRRIILGMCKRIDKRVQ